MLTGPVDPGPVYMPIAQVGRINGLVAGIFIAYPRFVRYSKPHPLNRRERKVSLLYGAPMLKPLLEEFLKVEGVSAAVVVGRDGFVIESAVSGKVDIEALGAMASTGLGTSEAMGNTLGKGELSQMLVELEKGPIILAPLSADELIALVADTTANVGRIRYELKKNKERIVAAL